MVQFKGVVKRFDKLVAVEKMDLDIARGSFVTLLGPSGCGKTTLLRMVAGLEQPTEGDIFIKGRRINDVPIHKRNLGMIFQNYALFPHKTIFDNVAFGLKYRKVAKSEVKARVEGALELVRLPGYGNRKPAQLSGGQQQRVALARAIVIQPDVLLMDEPLSALDENLREEMRREIDNLQQMLGVTTLFVTHDQREALSMSDKIVVMKDGRKQQEGSPEEVYNESANHFVADFLGHSNFLNGTVIGAEGDATRVRLENGGELLAASSQQWFPGDKVEAVVRAQKFQILSDLEVPASRDMNSFPGRIIERSYMGGEVSYFVEQRDKTVIHAMSMVRTRPFRRGEDVVLVVAARHCRLLPKT
ncbi:ABC transporter ATP-binding protein [Desulfoferrobacter suflitae]|uniref:ABC transporter ATP-binding protein n=1 Tax=Desulfoferrobacter suflitae TaxID=2865782 RepID=UPI00338F1C98